MAVLSISRNETNMVYKLLLMMSKNSIELFTGKKEKVEKLGKEIIQMLDLKLEYPKL